jgi:hypothetical protein
MMLSEGRPMRGQRTNNDTLLLTCDHTHTVIKRIKSGELSRVIKKYILRSNLNTQRMVKTSLWRYASMG